MSKKIAVVCGSFHKSEVERMLAHSTDEARSLGLTVGEVVWVPGSMEVPRALNRLLANHDGAVCLGIIEKGETQHGLAMGQAVIKTILELQLKHNKPIGLGIIGPGAEPHHIEPRLEPHARAAMGACADL
ncbi:MAG TPA: 6,7-dimethyl-8-ribityllumazine synthase [Candidatus Poseidoniales archaeon]|nr:6,7-dimethyl-8-ribityllumazine synthase [Euryarchaeota archaeon]DAC56027.1 MAG TPA: 6,7-dimethyl-8-ribityllumazine synthase [Candidatus Poseidoniales archaeon]HII27122.1 6,7-dimethyl-8-ribityllumazine synthase [Poseidonia sp.]|tara:strand:+ start:2787 stop:3176 length:390 start_codon:yes stop_codon:yes gene_type:complete